MEVAVMEEVADMVEVADALGEVLFTVIFIIRLNISSIGADIRKVCFIFHILNSLWIV